MASGFDYTRSQFITTLQFPSLSLQVQEVAHYLKEPNSNSTPVSSPSDSLKLFLSGIECEEVGSVESSCWGLRRLYETNSVQSSELVSLLLSKLSLCHHALPVVSLMGDLLISATTHDRYNLLTNQHPLALAFSSSPQSVLSTLFSLFSHSPTPLPNLWPCLTQILVDPQFATHRPDTVRTLLEITSIPTVSAGVSSSITRLLLLSAVYESEFHLKIQFIHSLLDFYLSRPLALTPSHITYLCYNTLLIPTCPIAVHTLLHKLKRLLLAYPSLLADNCTIAWLSLSLLKTELVQLSSLFIEITELVIHSCQDQSVSALTTDSLSLLTFSLLGAQLNLERVRPDVSSRYSQSLRGLLSAGKRTERGETKSADNLMETGSVFSETDLYAGELSVFASLSSSLLVCRTDVVLKWCQGTLQSLSLVQTESSPSLCCITASLLLEFTHDVTTDPKPIIRILLEIIARLVRTATNSAPPLIALLLLTMDRCSHAEEAALTLHTISTLSTHPACVVITLRSLLSLTDTPSLLPTVLRALISLWKLHDSIYPHIKQLIQVRTHPSRQWKLARSLCVLDICHTRPVVHGEEMFPLVQELVLPRIPSLFVSIGLSALASLVSADTVDFSESLAILAVATDNQSPVSWQPSVAEKAVLILRLSHKRLDPSVSRDQEQLCRCVQQLIFLLTHSHRQTRAAAVSALSDLTPQQLILIDPFSLPLRRELSIPDCLDLPPDGRARKQCGSLFTFILRIEYSEGCVALSELLSSWLREELSSRSVVYPREHKQEVERGEAAIRSTNKVLTGCLPKMKHLTDIPDSFTVSPHEASALLFTGRELWEYSETPDKLMQQYLKLMSRSLSYSTQSADNLSEINSFLIFVNGIHLFMEDALRVYRPHSSPIESLFSLLDQMRCEENPQGTMWLKVGLTLNVKELHSTAQQTAIQILIDSLLVASSRLLSSPDSIYLVDSSRKETLLSDVSYLALGALGGSMCAHLNQKFSTDTLALFFRTWRASNHSSPQLDILYSLTLYSILKASRAYLLQEGPAARKLAEKSKKCTQQIQEGFYPKQHAYLLLIGDVTLVRHKQQESLQALTRGEQLEISAINCSVLTCRLYSLREISPRECSEVIYTFLKLSREHPGFPHYTTSILLSHSACYGDVASQLLLSKSLSQLRSLLQQSSIQDITSLLLGILAIFGAFQLIIGPNTPPTPAHYSLLQQGVRSFLDFASPRIDKQNTFSHLLPLLGFIYSNYSQFSDTIRAPSSSDFLPDNILLSPLLKFMEEALQSGYISQQTQHCKLATVFQVLSQANQTLPNYPWYNLITCYLWNTDNDLMHGSLLKLVFKLQSQATEQELERISFLVHHWLLDPTLDRNRIGMICLELLAENIHKVYNLCKGEYFNDILIFLSRDTLLTLSTMRGLVKLMEEKETTVVQQHRRTLLYSSLKVILAAPNVNQLICDEVLPSLVRCMSYMSPTDKDTLVPLEGGDYILLRSRLFYCTLEFHWLKPCITYLVYMSALTLDLHSVCTFAILKQISLIRTLPFKNVSEVCLDLLNLIKSHTETHSLHELPIIVFNSVIILSLVSPEISRMTASILTTGKTQPSTFLLSEMTHFLIATCLHTPEHNLYLPILKKLYECLLPFFQLLDDNGCKTNISVSLFSLLTQLRHIDEVVGVKPWAVMGQAIFTHSKLFLD